LHSHMKVLIRKRDCKSSYKWLMNLKSDRFPNTIRIPIQNTIELVKIYGVKKKVDGDLPSTKRIPFLSLHHEHTWLIFATVVEVFIFEHTRRPFVNKDENLESTGSWFTDAPIHNTFVQIKGDKPKLFVFDGAEITERADI
jgi:hypothetical protein